MSNRCRRLPTPSRRETKMTPTDRLSGFGTGLATNSDSGERVPRGHHPQYSTPNGSARASFFRSLATQEPSGGDRDIPVDVVTSPAGVACWHAAAAFRRPRQEFLRTPHTDQLRRMVAIADRSPARYIFELKLAEVPSGPLNSKLMMFRPRPVMYRGRSRGRRSRFPTTTVVAF